MCHWVFVNNKTRIVKNETHIHVKIIKRPIFLDGAFVSVASSISNAALGIQGVPFKIFG